MAKLSGVRRIPKGKLKAVVGMARAARMLQCATEESDAVDLQMGRRKSLPLVKATYREARDVLARRKSCPGQIATPSTDAAVSVFSLVLQSMRITLKQHGIVEFWKSHVAEAQGKRQEEANDAWQKKEQEIVSQLRNTVAAPVTVTVLSTRRSLDGIETLSVEQSRQQLQSILALCQERTASLNDLQSVCACLLAKHEELASLLNCTGRPTFVKFLQEQIEKMQEAVEALARTIEAEQAKVATQTNDETRSRETAAAPSFALGVSSITDKEKTFTAKAMPNGLTVGIPSTPSTNAPCTPASTLSIQSTEVNRNIEGATCALEKQPDAPAESGPESACASSPSTPCVIGRTLSAESSRKSLLGTGDQVEVQDNSHGILPKVVAAGNDEMHLSSQGCAQAAGVDDGGASLDAASKDGQGTAMQDVDDVESAPYLPASEASTHGTASNTRDASRSPVRTTERVRSSLDEIPGLAQGAAAEVQCEEQISFTPCPPTYAKSQQPARHPQRHYKRACSEEKTLHATVEVDLGEGATDTSDKVTELEEACTLHEQPDVAQLPCRTNEHQADCLSADTEPAGKPDCIPDVSVKGEEHPKWVGWHRVSVASCPATTVAARPASCLENDAVQIQAPDSGRCVTVAVRPASCLENDAVQIKMPESGPGVTIAARPASCLVTDAVQKIKQDTGGCVKLPKITASRRSEPPPFETGWLVGKGVDPKVFEPSHLDLKRRRYYARRTSAP